MPSQLLATPLVAGLLQPPSGRCQGRFQAIKGSWLPGSEGAPSLQQCPCQPQSAWGTAGVPSPPSRLLFSRQCRFGHSCQLRSSYLPCSLHWQVPFWVAFVWVGCGVEGKGLDMGAWMRRMGLFPLLSRNSFLGKSLKLIFLI